MPSSPDPSGQTWTPTYLLEPPSANVAFSGGLAGIAPSFRFTQHGTNLHHRAVSQRLRSGAFFVFVHFPKTQTSGAHHG